MEAHVEILVDDWQVHLKPPGVLEDHLGFDLPVAAMLVWSCSLQVQQLLHKVQESAFDIYN